jgi:class 3 adenylate cyclase
MANWIRRSFGAPGLTQIPSGPHLPALSNRYGGTVMLCIDVSGSMDGRPILEAVRGARQFVAEAVAAHYNVGVMLWNHRVESVCVPTADGQAALDLLALEHCHGILDEFTGDRVVALFGDGDLTPKQQVLEKVALMKAENIRFVTRGLGPYAARELGEISDDEPSTAAVEAVSDLAESIADMASSLKTHGLSRPS